MARSKRRKDHNKAVAFRRTMRALEEMSSPPRPVKVGKNKFKVLGDGPDRPTTPEEIAALPEVQVSGTSGPLLAGEVVHIHDSAGRPFYARVAKPLRGHSNFPTIDDAAHFPGVKATVDGQEVPSQLTPAGQVILDEAPPEGSQVMIGADFGFPDQNANAFPARIQAEGGVAWIDVDYTALENALLAQALKTTEKGLEYIETAKQEGVGLAEFLRLHDEAMLREFAVLSGPPRFGMSKVTVSPEQLKAIEEGRWPRLSMGCSTEPVSKGEGHPGHIEMSFLQDQDGRLRFQEASLCPGPDPNGITDLKSPE